MESIFKKAALESGAKIEIVRDVISNGYSIPSDSPIVKVYAEALRQKRR